MEFGLDKIIVLLLFVGAVVFITYLHRSAKSKKGPNNP
jgi:hypothetical protein